MQNNKFECWQTFGQEHTTISEPVFFFFVNPLFTRFCIENTNKKIDRL